MEMLRIGKRSNFVFPHLYTKPKFPIYAYTHGYFKNINKNNTNVGTKLVIFFFGILIVFSY